MSKIMGKIFQPQLYTFSNRKALFRPKNCKVPIGGKNGKKCKVKGICLVFNKTIFRL